MIMPATTDEILEAIREIRAQQNEDKRAFTAQLQEMKTDFDRRFRNLEDHQNEDRKMFLSLFHELKMQQLEDHKMIMDIWSSREKVTMNFSKAFFFATSAISFVVSALASTSLSVLFKSK